MDYFRSVWELYLVMTAVELTPDWQEYIDKFHQRFMPLYNHPELLQNPKKRVNCTYKVCTLIILESILVLYYFS